MKNLPVESHILAKWSKSNRYVQNEYQYCLQPKNSVSVLLIILRMIREKYLPVYFFYRWMAAIPSILSLIIRIEVYLLSMTQKTHHLSQIQSIGCISVDEDLYKPRYTLWLVWFVDGIEQLQNTRRLHPNCGTQTSDNFRSQYHNIVWSFEYRTLFKVNKDNRQLIFWDGSFFITLVYSISKWVSEWVMF